MLNQLVKWCISCKNDRGQGDIINRIEILTKRGSDKIYDIIPEISENIPLQQYLNIKCFGYST